jgi:hypothetical protein
MVAKVDAMLEAKQQLAGAVTDKDKTYYENRCMSLDRQIDQLVYDMYVLTAEEIQMVEQQPAQENASQMTGTTQNNEHKKSPADQGGAEVPY